MIGQLAVTSGPFLPQAQKQEWPYSNTQKGRNVGFYMILSLFSFDYHMFNIVYHFLGGLKPIPRRSMYGIFTTIYPINGSNVGTYIIHGAYGIIYIYIYSIIHINHCPSATFFRSVFNHALRARPGRRRRHGGGGGL